jgi:hypothetical protein
MRLALLYSDSEIGLSIRESRSTLKYPASTTLSETVMLYPPAIVIDQDDTATMSDSDNDVDIV